MTTVVSSVSTKILSCSHSAKASAISKALDGGTARSAGVLRQILDDVVDGVVVVVHDVHDGHGADVARFKDGVAVGVDDGVVAVHLCPDELLHDVLHIRVPI